MLALLVLTGCSISVPIGQDAPDACGFPEGTALSYAGRSTTSALGVQEAVGDPMSDDPADIYITRDAFAQGELRGRLVCAIYVNDPGFVEITVHPGDGGRATMQPTPQPTPLASDEVEIFVHCGLDLPRIEYEGRIWMFDVPEEQTAPDSWGFSWVVVTLRPGPEGPIAIGPDGSEWQLIPASYRSSGGGCM